MTLSKHVRTRGQSWALIATAAAVVATCCSCAGSTGSAADPAPSTFLADVQATQATQATTTSVAIPAAPAIPTTAATGSSAQVIMSNSAGDKVSVGLTLGVPAAASSVQDPAVQACGSELTINGSTLARSVAIPVRVEVSLQTSSPVPMDVSLLSAMSEVFDGQADQVATGELLPSSDTGVGDPVPMYWATSYSSSGPRCDRASDGDIATWANVKWNNLNPGAKGSWQSWLVIPEQITPGSPALSSPKSQANWFVFQPVATIGQSEAAIDYGAPRTSVVSCGDGGRNSLYVAVDPQTAIARGCKSAG